MKLIKILTRGFKSFATKIELNFDGGIVGIVGPNGSGKSNINDAIRWVLGEQSFKSLRADNSEEVIFSGSKLVQALNEAEVSLTFDNQKRAINIDSNTITITRILKRGQGSNNYYINGQEARLKDIKALAMETGIGKSSLAIISQGTISDIAEANPEQRRGIFEEAAGVSKYKSRKQEALRKLDSTTEALEKLKMIVSELEKQVNPLRRQAEKAKLFLTKKAKLKGIEVALLIQDVDFFTKKLASLNKDLESVEEQKASLENNISLLENQVDEKNRYKQKTDNEVIELSNQLQDLTNRLRDVEINESRASERRNMIINGEIKASTQIQANALKEELDELLKKIGRYKIWEEKSLLDINDRKKNVANTSNAIAKINFALDDKRTKLMKTKSHLAILRDYAEKKSHLQRGVKIVVENKNLFQGFKGLVADLLKPKSGYETAIETVLKPALQNIVVDTSETAIKAINFLKTNRSGRATFIPLKTIRPKGLLPNHEMVVTSLNGYIGRASELVHSEMQYEILAKFLLGHILVADTIENATEIAKTLQNRYMVVSQEGDLIRSGGVMQGGQKNKASEFINGQQQIKQAEIIIPQLTNEVKNLEGEKEKFGNSITQDQSIIAELNIEMAKVREKKAIAQDQFSSLKVAYETTTKKTFKDTNATSLVDTQETLNEQKISIQTLLRAKRESLVSVNNELATATIQKTEFEKTLRKLVASSSEQLSQKNQAEFVISSARTRLSEEYEMTLDAARKLEFKVVSNVEDVRKLVKELRDEIKAMGHVNVDAIKMFEEVNTRYTKLKTSQDELFSAQQTILAAINEMDQIIVTRLDETFQAVNQEFNNVFKTMFGGGGAEIKYTDSQNILETGIEVVAQPPGKTVKNLRLFSGGEKSMIAISLLFAILKARPLPLCILDEVEAALDDANVIRYATYLQELKNQTQFIIITHRVGTMARVDYLFGATMQQRGVTSFFSVKLEEARKLVD